MGCIPCRAAPVVAPQRSGSDTPEGGVRLGQKTPKISPEASTQALSDSKKPLPSTPSSSPQVASPATEKSSVMLNSGELPAHLHRYGLKRRTISTSRFKRGLDVWNYYDLENQILGTGVSGAVRVVTEKETGRQYAIKTLSLDGVSDKKLGMLHNEVAVYLHLDHPNIAKLVEVYETSEAIHIIMEHCTGRELYDRLASKKRYSERDAAKVARHMLSAINYCHKHNICHRDLKLENWVYSDSSADAPLRLIDFGFSRIFNPGIPMTAMHGTVYYISPEVMDGCYGEKCDIWSIGVIVYMLLSGSPPFNGKYDHEILLNIRKAQYTLSGPRWDGISQQARNFVSSLIVRDPVKRPSAEECLSHPWLNLRRESEDTPLSLEVLDGLKQFALTSTMRRAALALLAFSTTVPGLQNLEKEFKLLDKSNMGTITHHDLVGILIENLDISEDEARRIFAKLDQTGDQELHHSEFLAAMLHNRILQDETMLKEAFARFDLERAGYITADNLRAVLGDVYDGMKVEDIVTVCDTDGDRRISYEEFLAAVLSEVATDEAPLKEEPAQIARAISATMLEMERGYVCSRESWGSSKK